MLKLSLYGFEFYLIKGQYVIFYLDYILPSNSIPIEEEAVKRVCQWINYMEWKEAFNHYNGPTAQQFKESYDGLVKVSKL